MINDAHLVIPPAEGRSLSLGGLGVLYKVLPEDTGGSLAVVEHPIDPGRLVRPHTHTSEDEISYVVEGMVGVRVGDHEVAAGPGTWVFKPRGVRHTFWNPGPKEARLIEIITPGGFVHYFEELAAIPSIGGSPDAEKRAELRRKYGLSFSDEWVPALKAKYGLKLVGE
ncbi:MAG: cupin domain-containing protein [Thaumarchaeota archaeon]|nr:cupin domain-containing protein [Nitrososphaerota archaeon]